jgi:hypothetical protein
MEYQSGRYGKQHFYFTDSLTNGVAFGLASELTKKDCNFTWEGQFRIIKNSERLKLLADSGLVQLYYGMESGSARILELMNKKNILENMRISLFETARAGILPFSFWLTGFPTETEEDFEQTYKFIEDNKSFLFLSAVFPFDLFKGGNAGIEYFTDNSPLTIVDQIPEMEALTDFYTYTSDPPRSIGIYRTYRLYELIARIAFEPHYLTNEPRINSLNAFGMKLYNDLAVCIEELDRCNSLDKLLVKNG